MSNPKNIFNRALFAIALDSVRESRGLTWKQVAAEADVSASTLTRIQQNKTPDMDGFCRLIRWSNLNANRFINNYAPRNLED